MKTRTPKTGSKRSLIRGRFTAGRLPEVERFTASLPFDRRLYRHDIRGSIAHARMLHRVGLLSRAEAQRIERGLRRIEREIDSGHFEFNLSDEDIHLAIERRLTALIGAAGAKLHTARSRNDQIALDLRLYLADEIEAIAGELEALCASLRTVARRELETVMPGYTHLQRAQPITLAHHAMAYVEMFMRDRQRMEQVLARTRVMPLGAGALAATTLPIDRRVTAHELGLRELALNSLDAVADRDFAVEFLAAAALCGVHLSRLSEDLILWASSEFAFVVLPDEFSTGSSMMPQKKNPDLLELFRGKCGRLVGDLTALLVILKGLPMAYNSDLQEDKERVFDAVDTLRPMLVLMAKLWPRLDFNRETMRAAAGGSGLATDIAEHLVERGLPFRQAHEIVGNLVRQTLAAGKRLEDLSEAELRQYCGPHARGLKQRLSASISVARRRTLGGPAPAVVSRRLARLEKR
ncbi:MAG TPA: argininosuccinate lyase [Candidatus Binataceae bacterium]|nr:argininosuccinate lyase [Candidatus Binataceae bacterium]